MSGMLPMAMFGLEIPPGDVAIPGNTEIPSAYRITMAAIDPSAEAEGEDGAMPRATLKVIRQSLFDDDDSEDDEDFDVNEMERMLGGGDYDSEEDSEEDSEDEEINGGPSDPKKSKAAKRAAAEKEIKALLEAEGMDIDDPPNGINGTKSAKALGKMPASDEDSDEDEDDDDDEGEIEEFVICTLDPTKNYQQPLDITIGERERVFFKVSGTHTIYLTGNYVQPADEHSHEDMYDPDSDEEEDYDMEPDSDELEDDYDEEDELDELEDPRITEVEEEEEEAPKLVEAKKEKKGKNKRGAEEVADSSTIDDLIAAEAQKDEKLSKKQQKKLKKNDGSATAAPEAEAPSSTKSDKKVSFAKQLEQGPTPTKKDEKKDEGKADAAKGGVRTVQGVKIDDRKLGSGPAAKKGDRVSMRYIGKLENGKVFDANKKGKPFGFKLGSGEVIKGWDIGIAGMTAGGERRVTIPANLGYGSRGAPPDIPGNSTLIFDVKLLEINKGK